MSLKTAFHFINEGVSLGKEKGYPESDAGTRSRTKPRPETDTGAPTRHVQGMAEEIYRELSKTECHLKLSHCCFFFPPLPSFFIIVKYICCCLVAKSCLTLLRSYGLQPTRLLHPWDFLGKNTGVGCHFLLQGIWTIAHQAPPSMGFPRQEYWSGLPFPSSGDLPNPETEFTSPWQADSLPLSYLGNPQFSSV